MASLWSKIGKGLKKVVNNPIIAKVASMAAPRLYNAVKMGTGLLTGTAATRAAAPAPAPIQPAASSQPTVSKPQAAPVRARALVVGPEFDTNTRRIVSAFGGE